MRLPSLLSALLLAATPALAQDTSLLTELQLKERAGFFTLFVPPDYPPAALAAARNATLDVFGTVDAEGTFAIDRIEGDAADSAPFEAAIRDVARFWMLRPGYDRDCKPVPAKAQARIWFEVREGKGVVAFAQPRGDKRPDTDEAPRIGWTRRPKIAYPFEALRAGREGSVEALVRIQPDGRVDQVHVVPGPNARIFGWAVESEFRRARYQPFEGKDAKPVCGSYPVDFRIRP